MGKQGPCCHCGVASTPLWRNGPADKPVLCNACGSRWRTKGTLVNYTPLHARAEPDDFGTYRASKVKHTPVKTKEANVNKRKFDNYVAPGYGVVRPQIKYYEGEGHLKGFDEDTSNRSSSGSAISNSESCAQFGNVDASDLTGPAQPVIRDSTVPSRKRTCVTRGKPTAVEKLTKDLYTIWHEQQSSCMSVSSEDDLLLVTDRPMESVEFGHGSVLIRHPSSIAREEESEASSLPIDHKQRALNSQQLPLPGLTEETGADSSVKGTVKIKKPVNQWGGIERSRSFRDEGQLEKWQILANHNSPLCHIDLQDIANFDVFTSLFTNDEQQHLLKFLPSVDTTEAPLRLKSMFESPQFKENLQSFQKLLGDGVFDSSLSGISSDDCRILKKLLLCTPTKSKWVVEQHKMFKDLKGKTSIDESQVLGGYKTVQTNYSGTSKRLPDGQSQKLAATGAKVGMKNPKTVVMNSSYELKEPPLDDDETFLSAKKALSSQNNNESLVLDSSHFTEESCDMDLLIELPSNSSFPQAELLLPTNISYINGAHASTSSSSVYPNGSIRLR